MWSENFALVCGKIATKMKMQIVDLQHRNHDKTLNGTSPHSLISIICKEIP